MEVEYICKKIVDLDREMNKMCHTSCISFGMRNLTKDEIKGKSVVEIGSKNVNGSLRSYIESLGPSKYIGVDIENGIGVDVVCDAEDIVDKFGYESFDIVICTELLEHIKDWKLVISNLKYIVRPNGLILITTRSLGFPRHNHPYDNWRYEIKDIEYIFSDFKILNLDIDTEFPGIFIIVKKPEKFIENDLSYYELRNPEGYLTFITDDLIIENKFNKIAMVAIGIVGTYYMLKKTKTKNDNKWW